MRVLGVVVGLLMVIGAIAAIAEGEAAGELALALPLGLAFLAYGVSGKRDACSGRRTPTAA